MHVWVVSTNSNQALKAAPELQRNGFGIGKHGKYPALNGAVSSLCNQSPITMHTYSLHEEGAHVVDGSCISITGEDERGAAVKQGSCGRQIANSISANLPRRSASVPSTYMYTLLHACSNLLSYFLQAYSQAGQAAERQLMLKAWLVLACQTCQTSCSYRWPWTRQK